MSSFYIGANQTYGLNGTEKQFGAVQAMQEKQEEKIVKEKEEAKTYSLQEDTVSISDEAKLANSQLNNIQGTKDIDKITGVDQLAKEVVDAVGALKESMKGDGEAAPVAAGEGVKEEESLEAEIEALEKQIKEKEAQLQKLLKDKTPEGQAQAKMLQSELTGMRMTLMAFQKQEVEKNS